MSPKTMSAVLMAALCVSVVPASADETGLDVIHSERREGRRLCFTDHFHYANAAGPTKKAAIIEAVTNWQTFTSLEYGTTWGQWKKAGSKKVGCSPSGGQWSCQIEGRPCK